MTSALTLALLAAIFARPMERISTLDPVESRSIYDAHALQLIYETPLTVDYQARPYRLRAGYCEMPEVSSDGLTYRLRTVKGSAADVVASLERLRDPAHVGPNAWILKDVATLATNDARTLTLTLRRRCPYFAWLLALPAAAVRRADGSGTGPYELVRWRRNHEMVFRRRTSVPRGFDEVRYLVIDDLSTQWLMFLRGEIDFLGEISRDNWDAIVRPDGTLEPALVQEGVRLHSITTLDVMHVGINMRDRVLGTNRKLRQALNAAFDFPAWAKFYNGRILRCDTPVPPGVEGRLESPFAYGYDLAKARQLLAEAGYAKGIDPQTGRRLTLTLAIGRASQASREQGELLASFYEKIGLRLELAFMTWDAFLKAVNDGRVQLFSMGWVGDYPDAQNFLQLFYSKNVNPGPNHANYCNAAFDREYEAALEATEATVRDAHWRRCQEIVREDCPWVFTHYNRAFSLTRARVGNYVPSVFSYGNEVYFEVLEDKTK